MARPYANVAVRLMNYYPQTGYAPKRGNYTYRTLHMNRSEHNTQLTIFIVYFCLENNKPHSFRIHCCFFFH